ncbi:helix-turn-helix domain-containing protein [Pedobacter endophyticus]|uniref:Helix-turn-helix transcriptional regulator n=1 Tax=Pedobacter endophyticus TaxID=2789740 RepID=A0A7S9KYR5_9SPHI|nr:helix-turn-helix transcriptional regulator [Pedobacter endophyticus]QPH39301.1 helix-turn-helix transcriptional regulator [Pedobacter endophyticus]
MKREIGKVIKACRQYHGFTQVYMAHKLGVTVNSYANMEHGRVDMDTKRLYQLAEILRLKACQILAFAEKGYDTKSYCWLPLAISGTVAENYQLIDQQID